MLKRRGSSRRSASGKNRGDSVVDRIGRVTVYHHGASYWLYYRERGKTVRARIEGNLATARATASKVNAALEEDRPSPLSFSRVSVPVLIGKYVESCRLVRTLSPRTVARYEAALSHFAEFCGGQAKLDAADRVTEVTVEEFVKYMRKKTRVRSGAERGQRRPYATSGIRFILSTCRSLFNYARKQRFLPPYSENPFASFPIDQMKDRSAGQTPLFTPEQLRDFFAACDEWQFGVLFTLALYGLRVGELTHLLVSDVDPAQDVLQIRSKPELLWHVKAKSERVLPILPEVRQLLLDRIGDRKEGFVFLNRKFFHGAKKPAKFRTAEELVEGAGVEDEGVLRKRLQPFLREMGQIPEKRIRQELMKLTKRIGCPEITKAHSLRHVFATAAQEAGANPITVQGILGHSTLEMTRYYTHMGIEAKKQALTEFLHGQDGLVELLSKRSSRDPERG